jgi:signal transduction histidine kinase
VIRCVAQMLTQPDGRLFWQIAITDSGAGIPQAIQPRIFEPFFSTKPSSGTGLGLNTVRKITWLYGGDIRFESESGRSTTFFFHLPASVGGSDALPSSERPDAQDG